MSHQKIKILFIGVNYQSDFSALKFIKSLNHLDQKNTEMEIIIVDNTERPESNDFFNQIKSVNQKVICLKSPENLGYLGGARFALELYLKSNFLPEWVIVSNVDLEFRDPLFLKYLIECSKIKNVGVVAPSIFLESYHLNLNPFMIKKPSTKKLKFYKIIFNNYCLTIIYELFFRFKKIILKFLPVFLKKDKSMEIKQIYAPHGSCFIFSKEFFLKGGNLNYPQFLFGEEIFVAETIIKLGLKVIYNPNLKLWHHKKFSISECFNRKLFFYQRESINYIFNKFFKG